MNPDGDRPAAEGGLLEPGSGRGYAVAGDWAILAAMVRAETAWVRVLADAGRAPADLPDRLTASLRERPLDLNNLVDLAAAGADGGNPVIPVVAELRRRAGEGPAARFVHRGLTSQDVLDTALMLVAADVLDELVPPLRRAADVLAGLAEKHRGTVMVGRTLTQHAVPTTFGLRAAQWLTSVAEALDEVQACRQALPMQCGGAAGTLAGVRIAAATRLDGAADPGGDRDIGPSGDHGSAGDGQEIRGIDLAARWAQALGLVWPGLPWHTCRRPVTRLGDVLAGVVSTLGHLATDVATLSRPEIGELSESLADGQGGSSTMPHKRNPVRSVLVRAAGVQAGPLAGLLHQCAALAVDDRSDGSWHAEWPTLQRLLVLSVTATEHAADAVEGLVVHDDVMSARVESVGDLLLSEWRGLTTDLPQAPQVPVGATAHDYLGEAATLVDDAVHRWREKTQA